MVHKLNTHSNKKKKTCKARNIDCIINKEVTRGSRNGKLGLDWFSFILQQTYHKPWRSYSNSNGEIPRNQQIPVCLL